RWDGSGDCFCGWCKENFRKATGLVIPVTEDPTDHTHQAFVRWRQQRLVTCIDAWNGAIRPIRSDASMIPNNASGAMIPHDAVELSSRAPMLVADRQARHGTVAPWVVGKTAKE